MDYILKAYHMSRETLVKVRDLMIKEMEEGLSNEEHAKSSVKMLPSFVQTLPSGRENGKFLALDLGGTNFRVLLIGLEGSKADMHSKIYPLSDEVKSSDANTLFDYIVGCLEDFLKVEGVHEPMPLGFTFSFPVLKHGLASGTLLHWAKEINCAGVVGKDVVKLLQQAIDKKNLLVECVALVNDTVGCLMSCAFVDKETAIGVIIGTGTNASYIEKIENIKKSQNENISSEDMIINMEWGGFGSNGCLEFLRTDVDKAIDEQSVDKNKQVFEKMISGKYLGEIARRVILQCHDLGLLFENERKLSPVLKTPGGFQTKYLSEIESDDNGIYTKTKKLLQDIGMKNVTDKDCVDVWKICQAISHRSSCLVSAGIAAVLNKMGKSNVTVGVDGSLYRFHPHFSDNMLKTTRDLTLPNIKVHMRLSEDGSGKGAAVIAAVAKKDGSVKKVDVENWIITDELLKSITKFQTNQIGNMSDDKDLAKQMKVDMNQPLRQKNLPEFLRIIGHEDIYAPDHWSTFAGNLRNVTSNKGAIVPLLHSSEMYKYILNVVNQTWKFGVTGVGRDASKLHHNNIEVVNIYSVENVFQYKRYMTRIKEFCLQNGVPGFKLLDNKTGTPILTLGAAGSTGMYKLLWEINECHLFHGTRLEKKDAIINQGLDFRLGSQHALFGQGIYFAESSTKADQYADSKEDRSAPGDNLYMFVARVFLGKMYTATRPEAFKRPPCDFPGCFSDRCSVHPMSDSVLGTHTTIYTRTHYNALNSKLRELQTSTSPAAAMETEKITKLLENVRPLLFREFVVYDHAQCFPEFLVEYKRI